MMSGIKGSNTKTEIALRSALHRRGFRFRLHDKKLPGKPDLVFPKYRAVIFVNGCFWHGHECHLFKWPQSRKDFWKTKIAGNKKRDAANDERLHALGWRVCHVWECALKGKHRRRSEDVLDQAAKWITGNASNSEIKGAQ